MTNYGVVVNGFSRKPLAVILADIEQSNIGIFGSEVIQTSQSPLGQLNGLRADLIAELWEMLEDIYQSYDPDEAEGTRLDILARLRLLYRMDGETDASLKQAITNLGIANVRDADFTRSVQNIEGVIWAKIYSNDDDIADANGLPPHSVCVVAIGGDDVEIATVARQYIVPGISSYGNTQVSTEINGFCRTIRIMRLTEVPVKISIVINKVSDAAGCPPPSNAAIAQTLHAGLTGIYRPSNGTDISLHLIRTIVSTAYPNVEVVSATGSRDGGLLAPLPVIINFDEIASIALDDLSVTVA